MREEVLSWLRMVMLASGMLVLIGLIVTIGGPALELIGR